MRIESRKAFEKKKKKRNVWVEWNEGRERVDAKVLDVGARQDCKTGEVEEV